MEHKLVDELVEEGISAKMKELGDIALKKIKSGVYLIANVEVTFILEKDMTGRQEVIVYRAGDVVRNIPLNIWMDQDLRNLL